MVKKAFAVIALSVLAVFAVPAAAFAYPGTPPAGTVADSNPQPGEAVAVAFAAGSFQDSEFVTLSVTGQGAVTIATFKAATASVTKQAVNGGVTAKVTLPADASGDYVVSARGVTSGITANAVITVAAADSAVSASSKNGVASKDGLASTGYNAPMLMIWAAGGALLLGIALVVVLTIVRRQRATA